MTSSAELRVELLTRSNFPAAGTGVTCAVSGGAVSLALLVLAVAAGCRVTAVHVDHGETHMVEPRVEQDPTGVRSAQPRISDPLKATTLAQILAEDRPTDRTDQVGEVRRV